MSRCLSGYRENFKLLDADEDGGLNLDEAVVLAQALGQTQPVRAMRTKLAKFFAPDEADTITTHDKIGVNTFQRAFQSVYTKPVSTQALVDALTLLDESQTGKLTPPELKEILTRGDEGMRPEEAQEVLDLLGYTAARPVRRLANDLQSGRES